MKKKFFSLALAAVMCVALFGGCASTEPAAPAATAEPTATAEPAAPAESAAPSDAAYDVAALPELKLTLSTQSKETDEISITSRMFIDTVKEKSNGKITFDEYFNAQLGAATDQLKTIGTGVADVGDICSLYFTSELSLMQIGCTIPFTSNDQQLQAEAMRLLAEKYPEFDEQAQSNGIHILFYKGIPDFDLIGKEPVTSADDFKGKSVGVGGVYYTPWFQALGATPVSGTIAQRYQDFKNNVIQMNMLQEVTTYNYSLYEVAPVITKFSFGARCCYAFAMNNDVWNGLDENTQRFLEACAEDVYAQYNDWMVGYEADIHQALADKGAVFSEVSNEVKNDFAAVVMSNPEADSMQKWIDDVTAQGYDGEAVMSDYIKIIQQLGWEFPFDISKHVK